MVAAKEGRPIPLGWALDADGRPTTDAKAALAGSMLAVGAVSSSKGAMLALVVELFVSALIGARFGFEASSFFVDEGNRPGIGQAFLVVDPGALAGREAFLDRIEVLVARDARRRRRAPARCAARGAGQPGRTARPGRRRRRACEPRGVANAGATSATHPTTCPREDSSARAARPAQNAASERHTRLAPERISRAQTARIAWRVSIRACSLLPSR